MKAIHLILILTFVLGNAAGNSKTRKNMSSQNNPLLCEPEKGACELPFMEGDSVRTESTTSDTRPVRIVYFTDPICSSCWAIEPQLRKLKLEYGNTIEIDYRMGGLLPDWNYNSGGISKPSDVAHHWDEVSVYYEMPIDGDVWLEDPLSSSYPPSVAFKAAQLQDEKKAILFLREIREMVFLQKKNITRWEHLEQAASHVGLDVSQFKSDYEGQAIQLFREDLALARQWGVRGFPTLFFTDNTGKSEQVYGSKPYSVFENTILKLHQGALKVNYQKNADFLFSQYPSLTAKEFAVLSEITLSQSVKKLDELTTQGKLKTLNTKNGSIWILR